MARFSTNDAVNVARAYYGIQAEAKPLAGYQDQNFLLTKQDGTKYVLKIVHPEMDRSFTEMQVALLRHIAAFAPHLNCPHIVNTPNGRALAHVTHPNGSRHPTMLITFCHGDFYVDVKPQNEMLQRSLGQLLGQLDRALLNFNHPAMERPLIWDISRAESMRGYMDVLTDAQRYDLVAHHLDVFEEHALPNLPSLRRSLIHNDANDHNLLTQKHGTLATRVNGIIDFGDALVAPLINELAVACAYAIHNQDDIIAVISHVTAGYHSEIPLEDRELALLLPLIAARLCISVVMSARQAKIDPNNEYLLVSEAPSWNALQKLQNLDYKRGLCKIRMACGLDAIPHGQALQHWFKHNHFHSLVKPDPRESESLMIPLSEGSPYAGEVGFEKAEAFSRILDQAMRDANAQIALGFYNEARVCYNSPHFKKEGEETRAIHLGVDIFQPAGSPIYAPLSGTIHSFANNANELDYGPTIILEHKVEDGAITFFTLYGHLSQDSLHGLEKGLAIKAGEELGRMGAPPQNGGWPPHLHFQIILDMLDYQGDYPGAATYSERRLWTSLSPDPNLMLKIPALSQPAHSNSAQLHRMRREHIAPSLSLHYEKPLHIVGGEGTYLFDAGGKAYIDMTNNVAHVGHSHPRVLRAMEKQARKLNTNTRYLHELLVQYAAELTATLPEPLDTCFFVNSGSEANDLAWRLARNFTRGIGAVTLESGYHGHTTALISLSHYKFANQGKGKTPKHVRIVPIPDPFRGIHADDEDPAEAYAAYAEKAFADLKDHGIRPAALWAESLIGCGGQIVPPKGFLKRIAASARSHKALFIADEVQVGFGRVGEHFWGFQLDDVVPDIVTMGKPIGNAHPLAAVVTTREIAQAFHNGVEYFNTFGGNPVSCAVGLEVLHVIQEEHLQAHAKACGDHLKASMQQLLAKYNLVGDARGHGLFLGFELLNPGDQSPATETIKRVHEGLIKERFHLGIDGPDLNVLKIKPPLAFGKEHADAFLDALDRQLAQL